MNEYFKGIQRGGSAQNGSCVLSTSRSVILPQAQLWYLIKAMLHHSAGKGSGVQGKACVQEDEDVWGQKSRGAEAKENVWARLSKMGTCAVETCRLEHLCDEADNADNPEKVFVPPTRPVFNYYFCHFQLLFLSLGTKTNIGKDDSLS